VENYENITQWVGLCKDEMVSIETSTILRELAEFSVQERNSRKNKSLLLIIADRTDLRRAGGLDQPKKPEITEAEDSRNRHRKI
jgi:hypothetical protein